MNMALKPTTSGETRAVDPSVFKSAMAAMPAAVTVITTLGAGGVPAGATLSAVTSLSMTPALMLACFDHRSDTLTAILSSGQFLIHVLADGQQDLAYAFSKKGDDKFAGVNWTKGPLGLPHFEASAITIVCQLHEVLPGGDHAIVLGEIIDIEINADKSPLIYAQRQLLPLQLEGSQA